MDSPEPSTHARGRTPWWFLALLAGVPSLVAVIQLGRIHPDEVYQSLEPAWFRAHGYGVLAWEWHVGLRNWSVPIFLSWILKLCDALGIDNPRVYRAVLELPQYALDVWALSAVYRFARRRLEELPARWATALVGWNGLVIVFTGRTMGESFSAALLLIAVEALDRHDIAESNLWRGALRAGALAGTMLGLAVVARYGSAVFVVAALGWLIAHRRWRLLATTTAAGMIIAALLGALDAATWGDAFHSLKAYVDFNVTSGRAAQQYGDSPSWTYAPVLLENLAPWAWIALLAASVAAIRTGRAGLRVSLPLTMGVVYGVVVSATAHKEPRFLYPALVLFALAAAPPFVSWAGTLKWGVARRSALPLALVAGLVCARWQGENEDLRGDQYRAEVEATRGDATGLIIIGDGLWGVGGFFYIGKNIPWVTVDFSNDPRFQQAVRDRRVNRAISFEDHEHAVLEQFGFHEVGRVGRETIFAR